jgi:hypothetical protein
MWTCGRGLPTAFLGVPGLLAAVRFSEPNRQAKASHFACTDMRLLVARSTRGQKVFLINQRLNLLKSQSAQSGVGTTLSKVNEQKQQLISAIFDCANDGLDVRISVFNYLAERVCKSCARGSRKISHLFADLDGPN